MAVENPGTIAADERIQVNLGSGSNYIDGFIGVDKYCVENSEHFRAADICSLPFDKESVDYILCNNVLEHLPMTDVPIALYEIRRVLKNGGRAVIIVPDFVASAKKFVELDRARFHAIAWKWVAEEIFGNQIHEGEYHRCPMSSGFLNYVLQMCGFLNYTLTYYSENAPVPGGIPGVKEEGFFRQAMIIADIINE